MSMRTDRIGTGAEEITNTDIDMGGHVKLNSNKVIKKKKFRRRDHHNTKKEFPICLVLQELYSSCRTVFKGPGFLPSPDDVQTLSKILDRMEPEDVGLSKNLQFFNPENSVNDNCRVTCTTIYQCKNFAMVLFFLPASAVIPLHNHPDMTVFSKLLFGKMHIKSYDWIDLDKVESSKPPSPMRLARLVANNIYVAPCDTSILYPTTGGNIHAFTAITPCVVLDVLGPPYSKEDDRDCTYYRDFPFNAAKDVADGHLDNDEYGWLEEIEVPENSKMVGIQYLGPPIIENIR